MKVEIELATLPLWWLLNSNCWSCKSAMSNPNGLLSQKLCHILVRTTHWMAYF